MEKAEGYHFNFTVQNKTKKSNSRSPHMRGKRKGRKAGKQPKQNLDSQEMSENCKVAKVPYFHHNENYKVMKRNSVKHV
jgi:hypothetical protein